MDQHNIDEEAREWIQRFGRQPLPLLPHEREQLDRWLAEAGHEAALRKLLARDKTISPFTRATLNKVLEQAASNSAGKRSILALPFPNEWKLHGPWRNPRFAAWMERTTWMGIAAACTLLVMLGLFRSATTGPLSASSHAQNSHIELATRIGEQRSYELSDGSVVRLNTNTEVVVDFVSHERRLHLLRGEAHFTVAKDHSRPFLVYTPTTRVQAVGTIFNIYLGRESTAVTVIEGRVEVAHAKDLPGVAILLDAGKQAEVTATGGIRTDSSRTYARAVEWTEQRVRFINEPVADIVAEMNRYRTRLIRIADPRLAQERITLLCPLDRLTGDLPAIARHPNVRAAIEADGSITLYWQP